MITKKRQEFILDSLKKEGRVTVVELVEALQTSESTIRRDLSQLEQLNVLKRVHGGAILPDSMVAEKSYSDKAQLNKSAKQHIASKAASLVSNGDTIYLDAGTTTYEMISYLKEKEVIVVTNGLDHIEKLIANQITCYVIGGKVKTQTKAIVGYEAYKALDRYQFDKCFIGANAVHHKYGYTTPDSEEAMMKEKAIAKSQQAYVLADETKFNHISFIKFAAIKEAAIITNKVDEIKGYEEMTRVYGITRPK